MNEKELALVEHFKTYHGAELKRCRYEIDGEEKMPCITVWSAGSSLGTTYIAVCGKCGCSLNVTDYDSW